MIDVLKNNEGVVFIENITSYTTTIETETVMDYLLFSFNNGMSFSIAVNSTAENIDFISCHSLLESIDFSGIKYEKINELNEKELFKNIDLEYSGIGELVSVYFTFEKHVFKIRLGMDCLLLEKIKL